MSHIISIICYFAALSAVAERLEAGPKRKVDKTEADMAAGQDLQLHLAAFGNDLQEYLDNFKQQQQQRQQMRAESHRSEKSLVELNSSAYSPCMEVAQRVNSTFKSFEQVGKGGFGIVFLAEPKKKACKRTQFILKCTRDETIAWKEALLGEKRIFGHPGLVSTYSHASFPAQHSMLLAMEYADSGDLLSELGFGKMSIRKRARLFHETLLALGTLHQFGIVHRDIKPANIFLVKEKRLWGGSRYHPLIGDFGLACCSHIQDDCRMPIYEACQDVYAGSPAHMSPGAVQSIKAAPEDDLWAMGQVLQDIVFDKEMWRATNRTIDDVLDERAKLRGQSAATVDMKKQLNAEVKHRLMQEDKELKDYNFENSDPLGDLLEYLLCNGCVDRKRTTTEAISKSKKWMEQLQVKDFGFARARLTPEQASECLGEPFNRNGPPATTTTKPAIRYVVRFL